jgi:LysR family transcriptional activator of glutamate synthase operon
MVLDDLRWFTVLARTEHATDAAARLGIPQPTLSRGLARLEAEFGVPLFDRPGRRLVLNRFGEALLRRVARALGELDAARQDLAALADPDVGHVRLGFLPSLGGWLVPQIIGTHRRHHPRVDIQLKQASADVLVVDVRDDTLDLGLTSPRPAGDDLLWRPLHTERLYLTVPNDHRLAPRGRVRLVEAAAERFIVLEAETGLARITDGLFHRAGVVPDVAFVSSDLGTVRAMVASGLGVAIAPVPPAVLRSGGLAYVPLADDGAQRVIGLVQPARRSVLPAVQQLADIAVELGRVPEEVPSRPVR